MSTENWYKGRVIVRIMPNDYAARLNIGAVICMHDGCKFAGGSGI